MSIINFQDNVKTTEQQGVSAIKQAISIVHEKGVDEVHTILGQKYVEASEILEVAKRARYSVGLALAVDEEEYYKYVENVFELNYALELFLSVYEEVRANDLLGTSMCLTLLPRIVEIAEYIHAIFQEIDVRWEEGELNFEMAPVFVQVCEAIGLQDEDMEIEIDFEQLLKISRSTERYLIAELVNGRLNINAYNEKKQALMAIMQSKTLSSNNLITRY